MGARSYVLAFGVVLACAAPAVAHPVTISPVGNPVPGQGPVGVAVAEPRGSDPFVLVADHLGNRVRSLRLNRRTGLLSPAGSADVPGRPSDLAVSRGAGFVLVSSLQTSQVSVLSLDARTGALAQVGSPLPSGGTGPLGLDITNDGFVLVANKDSDQIGVLRLNQRTGVLVSVGSHTVSSGPSKVRVAGNRVFVATAISNDVHMLHVDRYGNLLPRDTKPVGAPIYSLVVGLGGRAVAAGTYPNGDVHGFLAGPRRMVSIGSSPTGADITDMAWLPQAGGTLVVTGNTPRVAAFDIGRGGLSPSGNLPMIGVALRKMATVRGEGRTTFVIVNEYENHFTHVLELR